MLPQPYQSAEENINNIISSIKQAAPNLHKAGTFPGKTFDALVHHLTRQKIKNSIETGSGASTLLFSHLSQNHTVFAIDDGNESINGTRRNPLLRSDSVTFVEGPTQKTLPAYQFTQPLQVALIDGPHGYPFPELEYFYIYPHLDPGALLIIDDINVRTIHNLFRFLSADKMFHLEQVVTATAFFRRTDAPMFNPFGDGWWEQGYNRLPATPFMPRHVVKSLLPDPFLRFLRKMKSR
jgi:hypothetical protein